MSKKFLFSALLIGAALVSLTACSRSADNQSGTAAFKGDSTNRAGRVRRPDFGQPERPADVRGVIKSITGNEATILKIEMSENRRASSTPENQAGGDGQASAPAISVGGVGALPEGRGAGGRGGMFVGGGPREGGETAGATDRAARLASLKALSTGEETVIIPVGIKMMKTASGTASREMVEASLSDVITDKMVTVWLNAAAGDKKVAEFVLIN